MFFLTDDEVLRLSGRYGTPFFAYSEATIERNAGLLSAFPSAFGLGLRYAVKANPNQNIVLLLRRLGFAFEAGSVYEAARLIELGVPAGEVLLTSQELSPEAFDLVAGGLRFNATSLRQLDLFGRRFPGGSVVVRFNPGLGSGGFASVDVGGPKSSFGIWFERRAAVHSIAAEHRLNIVGLHSHIGSGSDPKVWRSAADLTLGLAASFPHVATVNLGGGFPIPRTPDQAPLDLNEVGFLVRESFLAFERSYGRRLRLELEPGTFLVGNAGELVARVQDRVETGAEGSLFLKVDAGMDSLLRPALYGARHVVRAVRNPARNDFYRASDRSAKVDSDGLPVVVVGHCCEATDTLTPAVVDEELQQLRVGDFVSVASAGAYCSSMAAKNYNSFLEPCEVLKRNSGEFVLIRKRQRLTQLWENEVRAV